MTLLRTDPAVARILEGLAPYARETLERAARHARRLHAKELTSPHVLVTLLRDEEAAATRIVLHAFADPTTIATEAMALCTGIMVVGSGQTLPFSVEGVRTVHDARALAADEGRAEVAPAHVFRAAYERLGDAAREALGRAGLAEASALSESAATPGPDETPLTPGRDEGDALFHVYDQDARRALGAACRVAARLGRESISPAHLVLACLELDEGLRQRTGLTGSRARMVLTDVDADDTPPEAGTIGFAAELVELLDPLVAGGPVRTDDGHDTVALLGVLLRHGSDEVRSLLERQKVTRAFFERVHAGFHDPSP